MDWIPLDHGIETVDDGMGLIALLISVAVIIAGVVSYLVWRRVEARRLVEEA